MTEHFTQIIGADEAVRIVCQKLDRFAAPNKIHPHGFHVRFYENIRKLGNIEVWFDPRTTGVARFHTVTHDDISIDVAVDFSELSSDYLDEMLSGVQQELNKHRANRRGMTVVH